MNIHKHISYLVWGAAFGFIISRSGAVRFDLINAMFLLKPEGGQLYGIIGAAIATAMPGFFIMRRVFKKIRYPKRRMTPGTLPGAAIFGLGWALTGTCPGPAMIQLGEGHWIALATVSGIFIGNFSYGILHQKYFKWSLDFCS